MKRALLLALVLTGCSSEQDRLNREFLDAAAAEQGAVVTASGLVYRDLVVGTGATPGLVNRVQVRYTGKRIDGTVFETTGATAVEFRLNGLIACWKEGLQRMKVGGKARLVCPPELAYDDGRVLDFEIDLDGVAL